MQQKIENKIKVIFDDYINGRKKDGAEKILKLKKIELFYLVSSHAILAVPDFITDKKLKISFENFVCNALEGRYQAD